MTRLAHAHDDDHGHGHGHGDHDGDIPEWPHKPAPPEPRRLLPETPLLIRGLGLAALAAALGCAGLRTMRASWLLAPLAAVLGAGGFLAAWAAAIELTGGEKFDDHKFV